jgi:hypothetical protein
LRVDFRIENEISINVRGKIKSKIKGCGQECPLHTIKPPVNIIGDRESVRPQQTAE